ncbi:MAG: glucans biosynthesis glucosyltransferase MdoH [Pseudomonadota bacterium]
MNRAANRAGAPDTASTHPRAIPADLRPDAGVALPGRLPPMPPERPLAMPTQPLGRRAAAGPPLRNSRAASWRTLAARILVFGGALATAATGAVQMSLVFGNAVATPLQTLLLALVTVTFGWIGLSAAQALAGVFFAPRPPRPSSAPSRAPVRFRTAIVMPVYHEDPRATAAALLAMGEALAEAGHGADFDIVILSDSRDADPWVGETGAFAALRAALAGRMAVWYRRRPHNTGRKAGNLRDFVSRWGGHYDAMLVLDADSLMAAETVVEMVRRMQADPGLGILQTVPVLAWPETPFARLQAYASRLYGPVVARGVAAWQGEDGNYWGHNALIRMRAFADCCGLPELAGPRPIGGPVLSHDFVEAALMRRAGWAVRMDPDLGGSWEGAPPSLLALAARDRRWAQGNLQHLGLIATPGLAAASRAHFAIGIGAYLMSPVWLAMIATGLALTAQAAMVEPRYFADDHQLFPTWPVFDAARMGWLFAAAMALLLLPKAIGLARVLAPGETRRRLGGSARILASTLAELLLSALYAPVMMLMQAGHVLSILTGRDSGWAAQDRAAQHMGLGRALARHGHHAMAGLATAGLMAAWAPGQLIWLAPVLAGLALAPWLSQLSGDAGADRRLRRLGLMTTRDEDDPPPSLARHAAARARLARLALPDLAMLARSPLARARHVAALVPAEPSGTVDLATVTAGAKITAAASADQALGWLDAAERRALAGSATLIETLARRG